MRKLYIKNILAFSLAIILVISSTSLRAYATKDVYGLGGSFKEEMDKSTTLGHSDNDTNLGDSDGDITLGHSDNDTNLGDSDGDITLGGSDNDINLGDSDGDPALGDSDNDTTLGDSNTEEKSDVQLEEINPFLIDAGSVPASTWSEVVAAINAKATQIHLTDNVLANSYVFSTVDTVIDGNGFTITQQGNYAIRVNAQNITITMKNMNIISKGFYGLVTTEGIGANAKLSKVVYDTVTYRGPQLAFLRVDNTLVIKDSIIDIVFQTGSDAAQELAEVARIEFEGKVVVTKAANTSFDAMWWAVDSTSFQPGIIVRSGADVKLINEKSYFFYAEAKGIDIIVEDDAILRMESALGWSYNRNHKLNNFTVGKNSDVKLIHMNRGFGTNNITTGEGSYGAAWMLYGQLSVEENSVFVLENAMKSHTSSLWFMKSAHISINNPKTFYFQGYTTGFNLNTQTLDLKAKAVNSWSNTDLDHKLYPYLTGKKDGSRTGPIVDGRKELYTLTSFTHEMNAINSVGGYSGMLVGDYVFSVFNKEINETTAVITGKLKSEGDLVTIKYLSKKTGDYVTKTAVADVSGRYRLELEPLDENGLGDINTSFAPEIIGTNVLDINTYNQPVMHIRYDGYVEESTAKFTMKQVPSFDFGTKEIPSTNTLYPRSENSQIIVSNENAEGIPYTVNLEASSMVSSDNKIIENALVYAVGGTTIPLTQSVTVYDGIGTDSYSEVAIDWQANDTAEGLVLNLNPAAGILIGQYTANLTWSVQVVP